MLESHHQPGCWETLFPAAFYLIADQQLHRVSSPFDQNQLVGLTRHGVREGRPQARPRPRFHPEADGQGEELLHQRARHPGVHVVGPHGEVQQESTGALQLLVVSWKREGPSQARAR